MFKQDVKIKKSSIKVVCLDDGKPKLVKGDYELGAQKFADGTLVFCGFRGNKVAQDVWGGVYLFDTNGSKPPQELITVETLHKALADTTKAKDATNRNRGTR